MYQNEAVNYLKIHCKLPDLHKIADFFGGRWVVSTELDIS